MMFRKLVLALGVFCCGLGLSACDRFVVTPVDISGQPIIGHWYFGESVQEGDHQFFQRLYMHVRNDGFVLYANVLCRQVISSGVRSNSKLILDYLPIKRVTVKKMVLQKFPLTPKFDLSLGAWPDQGAGVFEVDNLPLRPISASDAPDYKSWDCE